MSILTGPQIRDEVAWKTITVDPYNEKRVQPNSVDLTLGSQVCVYSKAVCFEHQDEVYVSKLNSFDRSRTLMSTENLRFSFPWFLDTREQNATLKTEMDESGFLVKPGILYLMHSAERIHTKKFVTQLNGKSSIARLGIIVHFTAAYAETGFDGQFTFEVSAMHPVRLYPGMAIAQAVFYTVYGQTEDYKEKGHYVGEAAKGAEPSHSWEQFT